MKRPRIAPALVRLGNRLRARIRQMPVKEEVASELDFHLEMRAREHMARGMTPEEARAKAVRQFRDMEATREVCERLGDEREVRKMRRDRAGQVRRDVAYAVRSLARSPGFTSVALVTLALGIGANTAIFGVVESVLLEPLPYPESDRLVMVWQTIPRLGWDRGPVSVPNFADWRREARSFVGLAAASGGRRVTLTGTDQPESLIAVDVSGNIFDVVGVPPALGRGLTLRDESPSEEPVVVLGHGLWQRAFGGDPDIVGRRILLDDEPHTVRGVLAEGMEPTHVPAGPLRGGSYAELWIPLRVDPDAADRDENYLSVYGRLAPGVELPEAESEMEALIRRIELTHPDGNVGRHALVERRVDVVVGDSRRILLILLGATGLVLLVACSNLAGMTLTRAAGRGRELAVRRALGAGRGSLVGQLVVESLVLACTGGLLGILVALGLTRVIVAAAPPGALPRTADVAVDGTALLFSLGVALVCGLLFGLAPALRASRTDVGEALREGGRTGGGGRRTLRWQRVMVVTQIAVSAVLLAGAGLLVNSLVRLQSVEPGFDPTGVLSARVSLPEPRYPSPSQVMAFYDRLVERLEAVPGVEAAGATWSLPFGRNFAYGRVFTEDAPPDRTDGPQASVVAVRGDYFAAMRQPLLSGRWLEPSDAGLPEEREPVGLTVLVNRTMAETLWPGEDAVGKRFRTSENDPTRPLHQVVGVVEDVRSRALDEEAVLQYYALHEALPWATAMYVVLRTAGDPLALVGPLRAAVREIDPDQPLGEIASMSGRLRESVASPRFRTTLIGAFAGLATFLALVGIYGVLGYSVATRTREFGVRMAVGASGGGVQGLVITEGLRLVALGLVLGLLAAGVATRVLESLLFEVSALDPGTFAAAGGLLAGVALLATWIPARRASRVDPLTAIRTD